MKKKPKSKSKKAKAKTNTGKPYEEFIHQIYSILTEDHRFTSVEKDVKLKGADGPRQVDVLLRSVVANLKLLTVIECRDYRKRLDVTHVDALHSKLIDVNASKGVLVSRKGFSKKAITKAKRVGIALSIASEADELLKAISIQVPIRVSIVQPAIVNAAMSLATEREVKIESNAMFTVNGIYLPKVFRQELLDGVTPLPTITSKAVWTPKTLKPPYHISDVNGLPNLITDLVVSVEFVVRHYFGHVSELPDLAAHHDLDNNITTIILPIEAIPNIETKFAEYDSVDAMPFMSCLHLSAVKIPVTQTAQSKISCQETGESLVSNKFQI